MMADGKNDTALGLGERLRSARKARALTLDQAAFTLRLDASVLRALEDERYDALGAAVFVRGHLKAYARLLGLSEEAVLAAYRAADPKADAPPKVTRELEKPLTTTPGPLALAAAVGLAALVLAALYILGAGDDRKPPVQPAVEATVEAVPMIDVVPAPEPPPAPVVPAPDVATDAATLPVPGPASPAAPVPPQEPAPAPGSTPAPSSGTFE